MREAIDRYQFIPKHHFDPWGSNGGGDSTSQMIHALTHNEEP